MRFCFEYDIVDAMALLKAAKRLLLAATAGANPKNVRIGTITIPPPSPIIEPRIPATNPSNINHKSTNNVRHQTIQLRINCYVNLNEPVMWVRFLAIAILTTPKHIHLLW